MSIPYSGFTLPHNAAHFVGQIGGFTEFGSIKKIIEPPHERVFQGAGVSGPCGLRCLFSEESINLR